MAAISDYLETQILNHIFRESNFSKPTNVSIALTSDVAKDNQSGATIPEIPASVSVGESSFLTNYNRQSLANPSEVGNTRWFEVGRDDNTTYQVYLPSSASVSLSDDDGTTFSNNVGSGYYYPLFPANDSDSEQSTTSKNLAKQLDNNDQHYVFKFEDDYAGVSFFAPRQGVSSGVPQDGGTLLYEGNGFIKNSNQIVFEPAFRDWGFVSGIAIMDSPNFGDGNLLMYAQLRNPRFIYTGDQIKFDTRSLEISLT